MTMRCRKHCVLTVLIPLFICLLIGQTILSVTRQIRYSRYMALDIDFSYLMELRERINPVPFETFEFEELLHDYKKKIKDLQQAGLWRTNPELNSCDTEPVSGNPCVDTHCSPRQPEEAPQRLGRLLQTTNNLNVTLFSLLFGLFGVQKSGKRLVILTAASSDHFYESQGLIQSVHQNVVPEMDNFTLIYYDIGLEDWQREQLRKHCRCQIRRFPWNQMPVRLQNLRCYTWKAFIIQAHIRSADVIIWADAAVRFLKSSIGPLLQEVETKGIIIEDGTPRYSVADHAKRTMFDYFGEKTCHYAQIIEKQPGFLVLKDERFVREVVLKPWVACAMSPRCMCPAHPETLIVCHTYMREYNKCHRFDQAAMNMILAKLFWGNDMSFVPTRKYIDLRKEDKVYYFNELES
ncbi:uncharacterized protein LOC124269856 [Haliotis rubra]|uniref:uncharacterized protein LOC124269856 n=1 Tax=Haliotis rubra TaxID=36100 RepID=UPI001EE51FA1|nr:uncharacterized protein LOC124269856 [Haliotis rubra]